MQPCRMRIHARPLCLGCVRSVWTYDAVTGCWNAGALQQLLAFMEQYVATTFWGQRYSWREQRMKVRRAPMQRAACCSDPCMLHATLSTQGGDILANALLGLVGGLVGAFGISSNLSAVSVANRPAAALEGFKWRFLHLGEEVEVSVVNGSTVITKVTGQRPDRTQSE